MVKSETALELLVTVGPIFYFGYIRVARELKSPYIGNVNLFQSVLAVHRKYSRAAK